MEMFRPVDCVLNKKKLLLGLFSLCHAFIGFDDSRWEKSPLSVIAA